MTCIAFPVALIRPAKRAHCSSTIAGLVLAYQNPDSNQPPPIPVNVRHGTVRLSGDGNHRLTAACRAGIFLVPVDVDDRDADQLRKLALGHVSGAP